MKEYYFLEVCLRTELTIGYYHRVITNNLLLCLISFVAWDGTVYEIRTRKVLGSSSTFEKSPSEDPSKVDLLEVCHLNNIRVSE